MLSARRSRLRREPGPVERPGYSGRIERLDEPTRVADLATAAAAHEAPKLLLDRTAPPLGLLLERAERGEVSVRLDDLLHARGA